MPPVTQLIVGKERDVRRSDSIAFYYGRGSLNALARYRRVVLQPDAYSERELEALGSRGVCTLAYLSLGEDAGAAAAWHKGRRNPDWNTQYVNPDHPGWIASRLEQARTSRRQGFSGLFLDTLDLADLFPGDRAGMLDLIRSVRTAIPGAYLLANRGFSLLPELPSLVDGMVFESFSSSWTPNGSACRILSQAELSTNSAVAIALRKYPIDGYALDYVGNLMHVAFARKRAHLHGLTWFGSNRSVTRLPRRIG